MYFHLSLCFFYTRYYLGQRVIIVIKDIELIKEVTVKKFNNFSDRPPQPVLLKKGSAPRGLLNAEGAYWKKIRVTLSPSFSASKMKMVCSVITCMQQIVVVRICSWHV